jgi:hypothetical protein
MEAIDDTLSFDFDEDFTISMNTDKGIGWWKSGLKIMKNWY